jgi:hypothetical protein
VPACLAPAGVAGRVDRVNASGWNFTHFGLKTVDPVLGNELGDDEKSRPVGAQILEHLVTMAA